MLLPSFLVTFREVLEIFLILGVVLAATEGLQDRMRWLVMGVSAGIVGSVALAMGAGALSDMAEGMGQELFNAVVLFSVSFVIGSTALWMRSHARQIRASICEKGAAVLEGKLPRYTMTVIVALSVWREGAEIILFNYGMLISGANWSQILLGSLLGMCVGGVVGFVLYRGLISIPTKYIFGITTWLLVLLSAGMASVGVKYLVSAGYFETFSTVMVDLSTFISESSLLGQVLHALFGYSERPMVIQVIFYLVVIGSFLTFSRYHAWRSTSEMKVISQ